MDDAAERIARLEANQKAIFHELDQLGDEIKTLRRLTVAVEKLANGQTSMSDKLDNIDKRLGGVERLPAENSAYYRRAAAVCAITAALTAVITALMSLILS